MVLWDTSSPPSRFTGFPTKVAIPCPNNSSLDLLACCASSNIRLDSVTVVLVSYCCCNKLPHPLWLKEQKCILLQFWRPTNLKSLSLGKNQGVGRAILWGWIRPLPLPASGHCQHSLACGHITPIFKASILKFLCICKISLCLPLIRVYVIAFRAHPDNPG